MSDFSRSLLCFDKGMEGNGGPSGGGPPFSTKVSAAYPYGIGPRQSEGRILSRAARMASEDLREASQGSSMGAWETTAHGTSGRMTSGTSV
jgi:hypothetical protein